MGLEHSCVVWKRFLHMDAIKIILLDLFAHLAFMPMSLCNHELSVVWCHWCRHHWHHLWTVLPATGLITETLYLWP